MNNWWNKILNDISSLRLTRKLLYILRTNSLPGFKGVSIMKIITFMYEETYRDDIMTRANSMAFSFFISLFPFLLLLFSAVSLVPMDTVNEMTSDLVSDIIPKEAHAFIDEILNAVFSRERVDLLSIGFILAIYFASNGMEAMMRGFDKDYDFTFRKRNWIQRRLAAVRLTTIIGLLCLLSIIFIFGSSLAMNWLKENTIIGNWEFVSYNIIRWVFIILLFYSVIASIYHYAPPTKKRFSYFSIGTNFATLFSLMSSVVFTYFVNRFGDYDAFYGPLGTLVMVMLWIQINCYIILAGFELNAGIAVHRDLSEHKVQSNKTEITSST